MLVSGTVVTKIMFLLFLHMKRCFITNWKASLIRTQKIPSQLESANNFWKLATSKEPKQHPNCLEASCISKEVFSQYWDLQKDDISKVWLPQRTIFLIQRQSDNPHFGRLPCINLTTMVSLHQLWQQCSKKFSTLTTRNCHCTGEGKGQGWPRGLKKFNNLQPCQWNDPMISYDTSWSLIYFSDLIVWSTNLKLIDPAILIFSHITQSWIWRKSSTCEIIRRS